MTQIPKEYKVVTQAIHIMPTANQTLKTVQQVYVDLWNAKYKNKVQANKDNIALYTNASGDKTKWNWRKFKGHCRYCSIQGHKEHICHKKKAAKKAEGCNKSAESKTEKDATDTHFCFKCKQKGHIAKNCPKKKGNNTADAFFVGMILTDADNDKHALQGFDLENEILLHTETKQEECRMASQVNHLSLNCKLVCLSVNDQQEDAEVEEENDDYDDMEECYDLGDGWDEGEQSPEEEESEMGSEQETNIAEQNDKQNNEQSYKGILASCPNCGDISPEGA